MNCRCHFVVRETHEGCYPKCAVGTKRLANTVEFETGLVRPDRMIGRGKVRVGKS